MKQRQKNHKASVEFNKFWRYVFRTQTSMNEEFRKKKKRYGFLNGKKFRSARKAIIYNNRTDLRLPF